MDPEDDETEWSRTKRRTDCFVHRHCVKHWGRCLVKIGDRRKDMDKKKLKQYRSLKRGAEDAGRENGETE